ncbi:glycosyltransferase family 39 protein [soil metagenome]
MNTKNLLLLLIITICIYFLGMNIPVMDIDAGQYAGMSREMLERGDFLHVYDYGTDYLDKPPFLFWINAATMWIFGANNFSFRFPSILFAILAVYATYRFALIYYSRTFASIAAMVLATSQAVFLITHDIRTDTILMGFVITTVWQMAEWYRTKHLLNFIIAFICIGGGMLTKGPIALFVPVFAFGSHFILKGEFKNLFRWHYILGLIIIALVLLPMSIGLYQQFDLHPEKLVNGKHNVNGLRFFYWTQSFGRITGESEWNNHAGFFFLLQNMLWALLPWILFFLASFVNITIGLIRNRLRPEKSEEIITYGGFLITYCSLALSKYQLPHYIFVVFPFAAIIATRLIYALSWQHKNRGMYRTFYFSHAVIFSLLLVVANVLVLYSFPENSLFVKIFAVLVTLVFFYFLIFNKSWRPKLIYLGIVTAICLNLILHTGFYPALLKYQAGSETGKWVKKNKIPNDQFVVFDYETSRSLNFYAGRNVPIIHDPRSLKPGIQLITGQEGRSVLDSLHAKYVVIEQKQNFPVTLLDMGFLNPYTREKEVEPYYIIKIL